MRWVLYSTFRSPRLHTQKRSIVLWWSQVDEEGRVTLIDFPQMVSTSHANAEELFERDVDCVIRFFTKKLGYVPQRDPSLPYLRPSFQANPTTHPPRISQGFQAKPIPLVHWTPYPPSTSTCDDCTTGVPRADGDLRFPGYGIRAPYWQDIAGQHLRVFEQFF